MVLDWKDCSPWRGIWLADTKSSTSLIYNISSLFLLELKLIIHTKHSNNYILDLPIAATRVVARLWRMSFLSGSRMPCSKVLQVLRLPGRRQTPSIGVIFQTTSINLWSQDRQVVGFSRIQLKLYSSSTTRQSVALSAPEHLDEHERSIFETLEQAFTPTELEVFRPSELISYHIRYICWNFWVGARYQWRVREHVCCSSDFWEVSRLASGQTA